MIKFKIENIKKFKIKAILNNSVYIKRSKSSHLLKFYYSIFEKSYLKKENILKPVLII